MGPREEFTVELTRRVTPPRHLERHQAPRAPATAELGRPPARILHPPGGSPRALFPFLPSGVILESKRNHHLDPGHHSGFGGNRDSSACQYGSALARGAPAGRSESL